MGVRVHLNGHLLTNSKKGRSGEYIRTHDRDLVFISSLKIGDVVRVERTFLGLVWSSKDFDVRNRKIMPFESWTLNMLSGNAR